MIIRSSRMPRREFIRSGAVGLAGAALAPIAAGRKRPAPGASCPSSGFPERVLGKTGLSLPIVSIGANSYDPDLYRQALDSGLRHIDTSSDYQNGNHERVVGRAIKGRPRDSFVIATSFATHRFQDRRKRVFNADTPTAPLIQSFEGSLRRLGLDCVDIFYLAWMCSRETTLYEPYLRVLEKFKQEGKARFIGITTHENEPEVLRTAAAAKVYDVVLTVFNFRQVHREDVQKAIAEAAGAGVGIVAMKTQAGASWDRRAAGEVNMSAALKWVLRDKNVHTTVPGITTYGQLRADLAILENPALTEDEKAGLEKMSRLPYIFSSLFCQQCGQCLPQCPRGLDVPTLMRSYMYAYGYKDPAKAKEALARADLASVPCGECASCRVRCSVGFNVRAKALDVIRLAGVPDDFLFRG